MNRDTLAEIGSSVLQHGPDSDRIYLMHYCRKDHQALLAWIEETQKAQGYSKHFLKVPASSAPAFLARGYQTEAVIPGFYRGSEDAHLLTRYFSPQRQELSPADRDSLTALFSPVPPADTAAPAPDVPEGLVLRPADPEDAPALAELYGRVFQSYPFPINDAAYIRKSMEEDVTYHILTDKKGETLAAASAEGEEENLNAEMTDFAVDPAWRGRKLAYCLLLSLEQDIRSRGYRTAYTIARLAEPGMNRTFQKAAYRFGGTLRNNTQIAGRLESMNVWFKPLL